MEKIGPEMWIEAAERSREAFFSGKPRLAATLVVYEDGNNVQAVLCTADDQAALLGEIELMRDTLSRRIRKYRDQRTVQDKPFGGDI